MTVRAPWGNPQPLASREASLATTLHNHMCPYSISFLLILYLAEYTLLFKILNETTSMKKLQTTTFRNFSRHTTFMFAVSPFEAVYNFF
jgi:hypothetical protein